VPEPPGNVDFSEFNGAEAPEKTARKRLESHSTNPACSGCHKITDPIGLTLESFDGVGDFRTSENGAPIDLSGALDGKPVDGPRSLGTALRDHSALTSCFANRYTAYALGRRPAAAENAFTKQVNDEFAKGGYKLPNLLRILATSDQFFSATGGIPVGTPNTKAQ
jgi:hypothetical protein